MTGHPPRGPGASGNLVPQRRILGPCRRFDRPRIEAERTLQRHAERLAHGVELEVIERDVLEAVAETVRPVASSLWIRPSRSRE